MRNFILILLALFLGSFTPRFDQDNIVGKYYINAYTKSDLEGEIWLKKETSKEYDSIYHAKNEVDKIVEFKQNGKIILYKIPNSYGCLNFEEIESGKGTWKRLGEKEYEIIWNVKNYYDNLKIKSKYKIDNRTNGDKILVPII